MSSCFALTSSACLDIEIDGRSRQDVSDYLARLIERLCLNSSVVDPRKLCILPGSFAWKVYVDVVVSKMTAAAAVYDIHCTLIAATFCD